MSIYTERLFMGILPATWTTVLTTSHFTTILRDLELSNASAAAPSIYFSIVDASGSPSAFFLQVPSFAAGQHFQWQGRTALNKGDQLLVNANGPNIHCVITGYVFDT